MANSYYATVEVDGVEKGMYVESESFDKAFSDAVDKVFFHEKSAVDVIVKVVELVR